MHSSRDSVVSKITEEPALCDCSIPTEQGLINVLLRGGEQLFVVGANGVGKSALMHYLHGKNAHMGRRILANRQIWLPNHYPTTTAGDVQRSRGNIFNNYMASESRYRDSNGPTNLDICLFNLVNAENTRARRIAEAIDGGDIKFAQYLSSSPSVITSINEILSLANIPIAISIGEHDHVLASKRNSTAYPVTQLSDGERNALLICIDVLTAVSGSVFLIDEPERHLHRSITSLLLTTLFAKRKDCAFIVSTHDILLVSDSLTANSLLLRNSNWQNNSIVSWDADLLPAGTEIPQAIKFTILGSKRKILFVEGKDNSLDKQLYSLIYPEVTVKALPGCRLVINAVAGIRTTQGLHWVDAYGLVDNDDRTSQDVRELAAKNVSTTNLHSVESLYYHPEVIRKVALSLSEVMGKDPTELWEYATSRIIDDIQPHKERLCARVCEKRARELLMSQLPTWREIQTGDTFSPHVDLQQELTAETELFNQMIENKDITRLISRYPVRDTPVLSGIARRIGLDTSDYERMVRQLVLKNPDTRAFYRSLLPELTAMIELDEKTKA